MKLQLGVISPQDWGLPVTAHPSEEPIEGLGAAPAELDRRARAATVEWLARQFDPAVGAFHGHYRAPDEYFEPPQTVNLIAPWQAIAAYDRTGDANLLDMAERAAEWFYRWHVVDHPMAVVAGGVRDGVAADHLWTKFAGEEALTCLALHRRTGKAVWLDRAVQSGRYLIQARRHGFAPRFSLSRDQWIDHGWDSWGRAVEALLLLDQTVPGAAWRDEALRWGEHGLAIQAADGAFYLIEGDYYNTDLAADELRALVYLHELTGRADFLDAARAFADWHLRWQLASGAWPLTVDRDGNVVMPTVGPGDVPNIGIALLRLHAVTRQQAYLAAALRALRYSLGVQVIPGSAHPFSDRPNAQWGFWSWDPPYDYTMSADQSTHHARGMWFVIDYWAALEKASTREGRV